MLVNLYSFKKAWKQSNDHALISGENNDSFTTKCTQRIINLLNVYRQGYKGDYVPGVEPQQYIFRDNLYSVIVGDKFAAPPMMSAYMLWQVTCVHPMVDIMKLRPLFAIKVYSFIGTI